MALRYNLRSRSHSERNCSIVAWLRGVQTERGVSWHWPVGVLQLRCSLRSRPVLPRRPILTTGAPTRRLATSHRQRTRPRFPIGSSRSAPKAGRFRLGRAAPTTRATALPGSRCSAIRKPGDRAVLFRGARQFRRSPSSTSASYSSGRSATCVAALSVLVQPAQWLGRRQYGGASRRFCRILAGAVAAIARRDTPRDWRRNRRNRRLVPGCGRAGRTVETFRRPALTLQSAGGVAVFQHRRHSQPTAVLRVFRRCRLQRDRRVYSYGAGGQLEYFLNRNGRPTPWSNTNGSPAPPPILRW